MVSKAAGWQESSEEAEATETHLNASLLPVRHFPPAGVGAGEVRDAD